MIRIVYVVVDTDEEADIVRVSSSSSSSVLFIHDILQFHLTRLGFLCLT